jgi:hypothetical protein
VKQRGDSKIEKVFLGKNENATGKIAATGDLQSTVGEQDCLVTMRFCG